MNSTHTPVIYRDVLNDLLNRYAKAVKEKDIEQLDECASWLASNLGRFNHQDPMLKSIVAKLKKVHAMAIKVIRAEMESVKQTLDGARTTQQRDMAYSVTQINTDSVVIRG